MSIYGHQVRGVPTFSDLMADDAASAALTNTIDE